MKKTLMTLSMLAAGAVAAPAMAADCSVTIEGNDQMQYNIKNVEVPKSCKTFTMNLKHVGKMPKSSMGHNIVLTTTADATATAKDSLAAGAAKDYVKDGDTRIIAHTKLIGGGESTSMQFDVSKIKAGTDYTYFCSFPGHSFIMKGTLKLGG